MGVTLLNVVCCLATDEPMYGQLLSYIPDILISPRLYNANTCSYCAYLLHRLIRPEYLLIYYSNFHKLSPSMTKDTIPANYFLYPYTSLAILSSASTNYAMSGMRDLAVIVIILDSIVCQIFRLMGFSHVLVRVVARRSAWWEDGGAQWEIMLETIVTRLSLLGQTGRVVGLIVRHLIFILFHHFRLSSGLSDTLTSHTFSAVKSRVSVKVFSRQHQWFSMG